MTVLYMHRAGDNSWLQSAVLIEELGKKYKYLGHACSREWASTSRLLRSRQATSTLDHIATALDKSRFMKQ